MKTPEGCGDCSACCYLLSISELKKPTVKWCTHCRPGRGGCSIYSHRPEVCRGFECYWLISQRRPGQEMAHELRPDISGCMFMGSTEAGPRDVFLHVFPNRPSAWKRPAIQAKLVDLLQRGGTVIVRIGRKGWALRRDQPPMPFYDDTEEEGRQHE